MSFSKPNTADRKFSLKGVFQKGKEYVETRYNIIRLGLVEKSSSLIASLIVDGVKMVFALLVLFFLSMSLGFYLSYLTNSYALGFLLTGGVFIFLIVVISLLEGNIKRVLINLSIRRFLQRNSDPIDKLEEEAKGTEKK